MPASSAVVIASGLQFPEGPAFSGDGSLWAVEMKGAGLVRYRNDILERISVGGAPNGIAIDGGNKIWFCDSMQNSVRIYDPRLGSTVTVAEYVDTEVLAKPNDLAFDVRGNILFTCPGESRKEPTGYACVIMKSGELKKFTTGKFFPNGLAFTPDGKKLILAETYRHRLWKGNWNADTGTWENEKVWCETGGPDGPGGPDGMAFDGKENLYVAVYGTGSVRIVNQAGKVVQQIRLQGMNPTNCALDPFGQFGLVVTEAAKGEILSISIPGAGMPALRPANAVSKDLN